MWVLSITKTDNGYIVEGEGKEIHRCYDYEDRTEAEAMKEVLYEALDYFAMQGSRYDKQRLYVEIRPGDKCEE